MHLLFHRKATQLSPSLLRRKGAEEKFNWERDKGDWSWGQVGRRKPEDLSKIFTIEDTKQQRHLAQIIQNWHLPEDRRHLQQIKWTFAGQLGSKGAQGLMTWCVSIFHGNDHYELSGRSSSQKTHMHSQYILLSWPKLLLVAFAWWIDKFMQTPF